MEFLQAKWTNSPLFNAVETKKGLFFFNIHARSLLEVNVQTGLLYKHTSLFLSLLPCIETSIINEIKYPIWSQGAGEGKVSM